jgi:hypothetical protein
VLAELEAASTDMDQVQKDIVFAKDLVRNGHLTGVRGAAVHTTYAYMGLLGKLVPAEKQS